MCWPNHAFSQSKIFQSGTPKSKEGEISVRIIHVSDQKTTCLAFYGSCIPSHIPVLFSIFFPKIFHTCCLVFPHPYPPLSVPYLRVPPPFPPFCACGVKGASEKTGSDLSVTEQGLKSTLRDASTCRTRTSVNAGAGGNLGTRGR